MDDIGGLVLAADLAIVSGLLHVFAGQVVRDGVDPNLVFGIRTRATRASTKAWRVGHRAAAPWLRWAALTGYAAAGLAVAGWLALRLASVDELASVVVALLGHVAVVLLVLVATRHANAAARAVSADQTMTVR